MASTSERPPQRRPGPGPQWDPRHAASFPRKITQEQYDLLVAAFRITPGMAGYAAAAKAAGVSHERAKNVWTKGVPYQGMPPVRQLFKEEAERARALRLEMDRTELLAAAEEKERAAMRSMLYSEEQRLKAAADSALTRAEEGKLVQGSRRNVMALSLSTGRLLKAVMKMTESVSAEIEKQAAGKVDVKQGVGLVRQAATIVRFSTEAAQMAIKMERTLMGEPTGDTDEVRTGARMTPEEAGRWIAATARALEAARARGLASTAIPAEGETTRVSTRPQA